MYSRAEQHRLLSASGRASSPPVYAQHCASCSTGETIFLSEPGNQSITPPQNLLLWKTKRRALHTRSSRDVLDSLFKDGARACRHTACNVRARHLRQLDRRLLLLFLVWFFFLFPRAVFNGFVSEGFGGQKAVIFRLN